MPNEALWRLVELGMVGETVVGLDEFRGAEPNSPMSPTASAPIFPRFRRGATARLDMHSSSAWWPF